MKILLILDPLKKLNIHYDSSLAMVRTFSKRGHLCYFALSSDLFVEKGRACAKNSRILPLPGSLQFKTTAIQKTTLKNFDAVLVRKEPPFNIAYIYMTYILELASHETWVLNHPRALRNVNEKFSTVQFPQWMPRTLIGTKSETILPFQEQLKKDLILKPLDERGGRGIVVLKRNQSQKAKLFLIRQATHHETLPIMAQEFISKPSLRADKRVFLLEGKFLAAYERRFAPGNFRGNLSQGAQPHKTELTPKENKIISRISPWLKKQGLHFVGLDLLDGKLLEINVTCPGGFPEADALYPELRVFEKFAVSVEQLARKSINRAAAPYL